MIDVQRGRVEVPAAKVAKIAGMATALLQGTRRARQRVRTRDLLRFAGTANAMAAGAAGGTFLSEARVRPPPSGPTPVRTGAPLAAGAYSAPLVVRAQTRRYRPPARRASALAETARDHGAHRRSYGLPHAGGLGRRAQLETARPGDGAGRLHSGGVGQRPHQHIGASGPHANDDCGIRHFRRRCANAHVALFSEHAAPGRLREVVGCCVGVDCECPRCLPQGAPVVRGHGNGTRQIAPPPERYLPWRREAHLPVLVGGRLDHVVQRPQIETCHRQRQRDGCARRGADVVSRRQILPRCACHVCRDKTEDRHSLCFG